MLSFLKEYQAQFLRTRAFCTRLKNLGVLELMQATFTLPGGERRNLTGFMAVNRAKLKQLDDEVLSRMAKNDELELVYLHLHSMQNLSTMLQRGGGKPRAQAAAEGDVPESETKEDSAPAIH